MMAQTQGAVAAAWVLQKLVYGEKGTENDLGSTCSSGYPGEKVSGGAQGEVVK